MNIEEEIKELKNAVLVFNRELFQANKLPARLHSLEKRIEKLESKCADVEVRKELVVLYSILQKKGIIDENDLIDMGKGITRFTHKDKKIKI